LRKDPHEMQNVIADPAYQDVLDNLKSQLKQLKKQTGDTDERYPELQALGNAS
ncbi:MAG: DUF4976 domain-containing protein, partial [Planctomycetaceae bacterium]|nr:DUF4976 domain-containing protein [Planctomycetaceae bacterium]